MTGEVWLLGTLFFGILLSGFFFIGFHLWHACNTVPQKSNPEQLHLVYTHCFTQEYWMTVYADEFSLKYWMRGGVSSVWVRSTESIYSYNSPNFLQLCRRSFALVWPEIFLFCFSHSAFIKPASNHNWQLFLVKSSEQPPATYRLLLLS